MVPDGLIREPPCITLVIPIIISSLELCWGGDGGAVLDTGCFSVLKGQRVPRGHGPVVKHNSCDGRKMVFMKAILIFRADKRHAVMHHNSVVVMRLVLWRTLNLDVYRVVVVFNAVCHLTAVGARIFGSQLRHLYGGISGHQGVLDHCHPVQILWLHMNFPL